MQLANRDIPEQVCRNLLRSNYAVATSNLKPEALMEFVVFRLYRNLHFIWSFFGIAVCFGLLARCFTGYAADHEILTATIDLILSFGLFFIGIPALTSIACLDQKQNFSFKIAVSMIVLQTAIFLGAGVFLFKFMHPGYFGFEQLPQNERLFFWLLYLGAILSSLIFAADRIIHHRSSSYLEKIPFIFFFATLGVGLGLVALHSIRIFWKTEVDLYAATIPASEFLRQLFVVSPLVTFSVKLLVYDGSKGKVLPSTIVLSAFAVLIGFQNLGVLQSQSLILYGVTQLFLSLGLAGFVTVIGVLVSRRWKKSTSKILDSGEWTFHLALGLAIVLTSFTAVGAGRLILSGGVLDNFRIGLFILGLPTIFLLIFGRKTTSSSLFFSTSQALAWCGLFIMVFPIIVIAPFGGSVHLMMNENFRPYFEISMIGIFMLVLSFLTLAWDKLLDELV